MWGICRICRKQMWVSELAFIVPWGLADDICGDVCLTIAKNSDIENISERQKEIIKTLHMQGYTHIKRLPNGKLVGLFDFIYTTGLCYGMDKLAYEGRYSYDTRREAEKAIEEWDGTGDPPGKWLAHK